MFSRVRKAWIAWRWLPDRIGQLTALLLVIKALLETDMDELKDLLRQAKTRIDEIVGDIRDLKDKLRDGGLTPEEVAAHKAELAALVESLTGVAAMHETAPPPEPAPVPEPTPEPTPEPVPEPAPVDPAPPVEG